MRIAVDAMGGDHAPQEIVRGALDAAKQLNTVSSIILVGDENRIRAELPGGAPPAQIEIRHASEIIGMDETPAQAVRRKKDSSIGRAVDMVKRGEADAVVSAGNTGAVVVAAQLKLRTLDGVERSAIATVMPTERRPVVLIDAGATTDCNARLLLQFAIMGSVYSHVILEEPDPVVGLLSIGGEESKGNEITKEAFKMLSSASVNFRGNVEGHDLFRGETDVVVCDGFVGNVILKTSESVAQVFGQWLKRELSQNFIRKMGAGLLSGAWSSIKLKIDPERYGGAPLLGVNGLVIITHGASSGLAIRNAIRVASESFHHNMNQLIIRRIKELNGVA